MNVPARIFASEELLKDIEETAIKQLYNVAQLPGIVGYAMAMGDMHWGYGFPIGGVAGFNTKEGVISPGGVGYDINCGVRLLATNLTKNEFLKKRDQVLNEIYKSIPSGVGKKGVLKLTDKELDEVLEKGSSWAVKKGFGDKEDLEKTEDYGKISGANASKISQRAKSRGRSQLGTLGAGNHFLEVQYIDKIFDPKAAKAFGLNSEGQVVVMIHSGSRGLGHQTASDYIKLMENEFGWNHLPDRDLISAPINSKLGKDYRAAMAASANFAFTNRQIMAQKVRESFKKYFPRVKLKQVYDVCHNIAKFEKHIVDGKEKEILVMRKGATRSFGPERTELPKDYNGIGQPVLIPGSMGTASYVLIGTREAEKTSFGSTAHGAGRIMSRTAARKGLNIDKIKTNLKGKNIAIKAGSFKGIVEEAPEAYKDIDEVVGVSDEVGIGKMVARLKPLGVVKG